MSKSSLSVVEDTGSVTVCAEINSTTLPFQMSATAQISTVSLSAGTCNNYNSSFSVIIIFLHSMHR